MAGMIRQILPIQQHSPFYASVTAVMRMMLLFANANILLPSVLPLGCFFPR